ncbi:DUF2271 domain-containing protein [Rhodopseudomonas palustris]|uniref:DUF2271 domain-containing protein n=1 Tax=Rhodopseudomonas palustris (strain BisB18) TaxID=316056 RepID=Q21BK5_RHOPB
MPSTGQAASVRLRHFLAVLVVGAVIGLEAMPAAEAARLRLRATMERYSGNPAYLAVYLTDAKGHFVATVQIFGDKVQYYPHLSHWMRAVGPQSVPLDGITGASVGSGRGLDVTVEVADTLIGAGLQLRVDAAAENIADNPAEIILPLEKAADGRDAIGRGLIARFHFEM